jgi:hypothetical protein
LLQTILTIRDSMFHVSSFIPWSGNVPVNILPDGIGDGYAG